MDNLAFIAACFPEDMLNELIKNGDIRDTDIAANVFGYKIAKCLSELPYRITVINEHKAYRFPQSKEIIKKGSKLKYENVLYDSYSYINIPYLDRISKERRIAQALKRIKPKVVVVYCMHTPYLRPVIRLKKTLGYKVVQIVPDLPEFMLKQYGFPLSIAKKLDVNNLYRLSCHVDGFIILTKYMKQRLLIGKKKYLVLEGIADVKKDGNGECYNREDYILYSGTVTKEYGLPEFIEQYIASGIKEKLFICGGGPYVSEIKNISQSNSKIKYIGVLDRDELYKYQKSAVLLVNPRSGNDTYTKYSFPSKTLEYLLAGTPVMMERLAGIPDEYYKYIIEVKNSDWISALQSFSSSDKSALFALASEARQYIVDHKTISPQAKRITKFIEELLDEK